MHSHARYTSESSNTTNSSGSTDQTYVPDDDNSPGCAQKTETYPRQAIGHLGERRDATAVGFSELYQQNAQLSMENRFHSPRQDHRIPFERQHSNVLNRESGYIPESYPMLRDSLYERKRSIDSEFDELKKNYKRMRMMFLILACLCIVLIICVISVLPVILVSFRMENNNGQQLSDDPTPELNYAFKNFVLDQLRSHAAKDIIWKHIFCSKCQEEVGDTYSSEKLEFLYLLGCCQEDVLSKFISLKDEFTEKFKTHNSDMLKYSDRIEKLEDEVITLRHSGTKRVGNNTTPSSPSSFEGSVLQQRMEKLKGKMESNNKLLNTLLGWKRASMQLKGTVKSDSIEWENDVSNGKIISMSNNKLHVRSGGTYFIYINVQFTKFNCTKEKEFHYALMEDKGGIESAVARVRHTCIGISNSIGYTLNLQKVVEVQLGERASFYVNIPSYALSNDPWAHHVFGIIEV